MHESQSITGSTSTLITSAEFAALTEPFRHELQVHCYRLLGSLQDAEDIVQETMLRAWQKRGALRDHSALRAWLYKIATNTCLDELRRRPKRSLPALVIPGSRTAALPAPPTGDPIWIEPMPDEWLASPDQEPHTRYSRMESVSLAFLAALQFLPPRQRATLVLSDVLDWRANEIAKLLGITVSAVNSALHRARVTLSKHYHAEGADLKPHRDAAIHGLLNRYVLAWENSDVEGLVSLLASDAHLSMPPTPSWYIGREAIQGMLSAMAFANAPPGTWRLKPSHANGSPAFATYHRGDRGEFQPFGVMLVHPEKNKIQEVYVFMAPHLVAYFDKQPDRA
jgi:RNA polymerase sigma-70 factor (ECF subfamily)